MTTMDMRLEQVLAAARARRAALTVETAGYIALGVADALAVSPGVVRETDVVLDATSCAELARRVEIERRIREVMDAHREGAGEHEQQCRSAAESVARQPDVRPLPIRVATCAVGGPGDHSEKTC